MWWREELHLLGVDDIHTHTMAGSENNQLQSTGRVYLISRTCFHRNAKHFMWSPCDFWAAGKFEVIKLPKTLQKKNKFPQEG